MTRKQILRIMTALMLIVVSVPIVWGQGTGQICVRAFEDRNGNGVADPGEPNLTRGISADLLDASGVIIQSQLLENSTRVSQGLLCFQNLEAGQYTLNVNAADYVPTGAQTYGVSISNSAIPDVFEYGAQVVVSETPTETTSDQPVINERALLERILFSTLGAAFVVGAMTVIGSLIFFLRFRNKQPRYTVESGMVPAVGAMQTPRPTTGNMQPVRPPTNPTPPVAQDTPPRGMPATDIEPGGLRPTRWDDDDDLISNEPPISDEDTDRFRPPTA